MKKALGLTLLAAFALVSLGFQRDQDRPSAADETMIVMRSKAFAEAWNRHDAAALAGQWSAEGDLINPWGRVAKGHAAVETLFREEQAGPMKDSHMELKVTSIRYLTSTAVVDWDVTLTNVKTPDSVAPISLPHHVTLVMSRGADRAWWTEAARPYVFLQAAQPAQKKTATMPPGK